MEFAITFKGDIDLERTVALCKQAEVAGFDYAWFFDSHVLWQECYTTMAVCMRETRKLRFGPCVTNPGVRDWTVAASTFATLAKISGNRFDLGVGRGDSSLRMLGQKPRTVKQTCEFMDVVRRLGRGETVHVHDRDLEFPWADPGTKIPCWFAAYGPRALEAAGAHADGLVLQIADPWLVKWFSDQARAAARAAGRNPSDLRVMAAAPVWVGEAEKCRAQTRWFPAMVGNHVADLVEKYGSTGQDVPQRLTDYVRNRRGYDYKKHARKDADHLDFINDEIVDSFCVLGSVEDHIRKLEELARAGMTQFNIYLMCGEEERQIAEYGEKVLPHVKKALALV
ncbi:MAG: TIGR03842 family LLM class F420-dependent oxidoreductase [Armatimonadetes bacterium]|nr:TIGR03842 family LLM class F420-dependent oxidoreductase [Armatimonadota bacterium]